MNTRTSRSPIVRLVAWSASHPWWALLAAAVVMCASVVGVVRMRISGSFVDMFESDSPAAAAMVRIASGYRTADELLVLVTLPAEGGRAKGGEGAASDTAALVRYAQRFEELVAADPLAAGMAAYVRSVRDPEFEAYVRRVAIPASAYFLSDAGFETLIERLGLAGMRVQLKRGEALLAAPGPAASAIAKAVLRDPLRIAELVDDDSAMRAESARFVAEGQAAELHLSDDRRTLLIRVAGNEQVDNLEFSRHFTDRMSAIASEANVDGLSVELAGGYAIAARTSRGIRQDSILSVIVSVVLVQVLFVVFYRRPGAPLIIGAVAALGILAGFGVQGFVSPTITPLTAVIAALLAGLGIDYGIHFISHYQTNRASGMGSAEASAHTAANVGLPIVTNCFTSIFGFASLWGSEVRMLSDFAMLGSLGLLGALVSVFVVMPALLAVADRRPPGSVKPPRFRGVAGQIARRARACMTGAIVVLCLVGLGAGANGFLPGVEGDLSVMHPRPNAALDATRSVGARFTEVGENLPVEIRAATAEGMLLAAHDAAAALSSPEVRGLGITGVIGIHRLVPDPRKSSGRAARLAGLEAQTVVEAFDVAVAESAFDAGAFAAYRDWLAEVVGARPPDLASLGAFPAIREQVFPRRAGREGPEVHGTLLAVRLAAPLDERGARDATVAGIRRLLAPVPGATLSGMSAITYDLEVATRGDLPRSVAISLALVLMWLMVVFRRPAEVLLAITPLVFAVICTAGTMTIFGLRINAVNGVAIPLLQGIAVDAGVFLVATARLHARDSGAFRLALDSTAQAVLASTTTTATGFAALWFTSTPAIRSLGMLGAIGVTASLIGALLFLLPLLLVRADRSARRGRTDR